MTVIPFKKSSRKEEYRPDPANGEVYATEFFECCYLDGHEVQTPAGFAVVHESRSGSSAGVQRGFKTMEAAKTAAIAEAVRRNAVLFHGKPALVSFASYLIRLRCSGIAPDLLVRYLNSRIGRAWVSRVASQQVGQANVNGTKLKSLGIPLPPVGEQAEMNRLLTLAFARADRLEAEAVRARTLLDRLESSILAKAFRGELVPQGDNDEPARVLLDRVREERAARPKKVRTFRKSSAHA